MKYFLDNCLSYRYAAMLTALGMGDVTSLREHFAENALDEVWIPALGTNGWTLLGCDRGQLRKPEEKIALRDAGAIAFYLARAFDNLQLVEKAWRLVKAWPAITETAERTRGGQCYLVHVNCSIEVYLPR